MAPTLAEQVLMAVRAVNVLVTDVRIGKADDKRTWLVSPTSLQAAAQPTIDAFDPTSAQWRDTVLLATATQEAALKDVLATCALVAKYTDPVGWAAMSNAQKVARVRTLAQDYRDFRIFVEKSL